MQATSHACTNLWSFAGVSPPASSQNRPKNRTKGFLCKRFACYARFPLQKICRNERFPAVKGLPH